MWVLFLHLLLSAFLMPVIGTIIILPIAVPILRFDALVDYLFVIGFASYAPFFAWYIFVPLGCCSFLFFQTTATKHHKGVKFWFIAWTLIGGASGAAFHAIMGAVDSNLRVLSEIGAGAVAGILIAPLHRRMWAQLYPEYYPRLPLE